MTSNEIKKLRLALKMTQAKFSNVLGCTITTLSRWENGVVNPSRLYVKELRIIEKTLLKTD